MIRLALLLLTCSAPPLQGDLPCTSPDCPPWIWPLSGDVYQPRRLLNTHGQLVRILDGAEPQSHRGIDIGAGAANGAGETVRAVADGMVVAIQYQGPGSFQNRVMIAPEAETTWALAYVHLAEVWVHSGALVKRGQVIGRVAEWTGEPHYRHLHFSIVRRDLLTPCCEPCKLEELWNPLPFLAGRLDLAAPEIEMPPHYAGVVGAESGSPPPPILFFTDTEAVAPLPIDPDDIVLPAGEAISMAARIHDFFPQVPILAMSSYERVAPLRVGVAVRRWISETLLDPFGTSGHLEVVFCNEIDFLGVVEAGDAYHLYRADPDVDSKGSDVVHDFYFDLCSTPQAKGAWKTPELGPGQEARYRIEVTAEDASGNVQSVECAVTVKKP